jgi:hypothetical protein
MTPPKKSASKNGKCRPAPIPYTNSATRNKNILLNGLVFGRHATKNATDGIDATIALVTTSAGSICSSECRKDVTNQTIPVAIRITSALRRICLTYMRHPMTAQCP